MSPGAWWPGKCRQCALVAPWLAQLASGLSGPRCDGQVRGPLRRVRLRRVKTCGVPAGGGQAALGWIGLLAPLPALAHGGLASLCEGSVYPHLSMLALGRSSTKLPIASGPTCGSAGGGLRRGVSCPDGQPSTAGSASGGASAVRAARLSALRTQRRPVTVLAPRRNLRRAEAGARRRLVPCWRPGFVPGGGGASACSRAPRRRGHFRPLAQRCVTQRRLVSVLAPLGNCGATRRARGCAPSPAGLRGPPLGASAPRRVRGLRGGAGISPASLLLR